MTDDDTNEETARPTEHALRQSETRFEWVLTHSAETLIWLGTITTRCEDRSSSNGNCILPATQALVHIENNAVQMERNMTFQQGVSGNPHGNRHRTRHLLNQEFMQALLLNFRHQGKKAIEKVARNQPAAYLKILALLVPREMKVEHAGGVKAMTDEQLEAGIEAIQRMLEARAPGDRATLIEGTAETVALPAPDPDDNPKRPNKVMDAADTALGPKERKPRKACCRLANT
jgi:hypothetical protein